MVGHGPTLQIQRWEWLDNSLPEYREQVAQRLVSYDAILEECLDGELSDIVGSSSSLGSDSEGSMEEHVIRIRDALRAEAEERQAQRRYQSSQYRLNIF